MYYRLQTPKIIPEALAKTTEEFISSCAINEIAEISHDPGCLLIFAKKDCTQYLES